MRCPSSSLSKWTFPSFPFMHCVASPTRHLEEFLKTSFSTNTEQKSRPFLVGEFRTMATEEERVALVCDMNNAAVDLLVAGLFDSAGIVFAKAIRVAMAITKEHRDIFREISVRDVENERMSTSFNSWFQTSTVSIRCSDAKILAGQANAVSSDDKPFVYQRAYKFRSGCGTPPFETVCIVILYNMAIRSHLHNFVSFSRQELIQAATLYRLALSSACMGGTTNIIHAGIPPVLHLVILNNLGAIYFQLSQYNDMASVFDSIRNSSHDALIVAVTEEPFLNQVEKHGLLWNLTFCKRPDRAAAA